jgi:hypothetical protein
LFSIKLFAILYLDNPAIDSLYITPKGEDVSMSTDEKKERVEEEPKAYEAFDRFEIINNIRYDMKPSTVNHQQFVTHLLSLTLYNLSP